MIIKFTKKEALNCSFCFSNKPSFQMISLDPVPGKDGGLVFTCTTTLMCDECLKSELDGFHRSLRQSKNPLAEGETEDDFLYRQIAVVVVQISLSYEEARLLARELQTNGLECVVD